MVTKAELVDVLARHYGGDKAEATKALNAVLETITYQTAVHGRVVLTGFGTFEKVDRPPRVVQNPHTGKPRKEKRSSVPHFRAGSDLKAYVAGDKKVPRSARQPAAKKAPARRRPAAAAATAKEATDSVALQAGRDDVQPGATGADLQGGQPGSG